MSDLIKILSLKSSVIEQTSVAAQDIEQKINYEIRRAQSVSDFSPAKVVLQEADGPVTIENTNGLVTIQRGSNDPASLQANDINVDDLVFTQQVSGTGDTQYVGFSFDAVAAFPGSTSNNMYQYSLPVQSGAALRTQ